MLEPSFPTGRWHLASPTEFNSQNSIVHDTKSLITKYKNIITTMKKIAKEKQAWIDIGNGSYVEVQYSDAEKRLAPLMQRQLTELTSKFDDDNDQAPTNHLTFSHSNWSPYQSIKRNRIHFRNSHFEK